jgi:arabinofuranosyltransferase
MNVSERNRIPLQSLPENFYLLMNKSHSFLWPALLAAAAMLLGMAWVGDDAFITLRVIDNFVNGHGLRYNVIERVQVFTHPLWLMLLAPFYAATREPLLTTMLASVMVSLGALWLLAARVAARIEYGSLLVLAAAASYTLSSFATSGLELPLSYFLLALFVWRARAKSAWIPAGVFGLLLLNRLDLAVLLGPAMAYLLFRAQGSERVKAALAAGLPALAWMGFSTVYYGSPLPNTAYAKLGTGLDSGTLIARGLEYTKDFALTDPFLALIIVAGVFNAWRARATMTLGAGIVLYVAYIIAIGGDFMSGRFFAAPGFLALCLLAQTTPQWLPNRWKLAGALGMGVLAVLLVARMLEQPVNSLMIAQNGIIDERRFYWPDTGLVPLLKGWMATKTLPTPTDGQRGMELKAEAERRGQPIVVASGAVGMRGYYGGPSVHILDEYALTDAFLARLPAVYGARVGHYARLLPPGYGETVLGASPTTENAALRPLLDDVTLATRAPLWDAQRWGAIGRLFAGRYR